MLKTMSRTGKHGHRREKEDGKRIYSPEYTSWMAMKRRCLYRKHPRNWKYRRIKISNRYLGTDGFLNFLNDLGPCPKNSSTWINHKRREYTLERINNHKGYIPGNIKWATWTEQETNRDPLTMCRKGLHKFTPENTILHGRSRARLCRKCEEARRNKWIRLNPAKAKYYNSQKYKKDLERRKNPWTT